MKKILFGVVGSILIILGAAGYYSTTLTSNDKILSNIYIYDVNVGGMTKDEALKILKNDNTKTGITVTLTHKEKKIELDASEFGYDYDIKGAVEKAYNTGRGDSFISNMMTALSQELLSAEERIEPPLKLLENKYDKAIDSIAKNIETPMVDASIKIEQGKVVIEEGTEGIVIDRELLKKEIKEKLEEKELFRADKATNYTIEIPAKVQEQIVKSEKLKKITGIIGEFSTKYNKANKGREKNITLAAKSLNDKIIQPGSILSYSEEVGEITYANGFENDTVIVNGEIEQGVGGGVCQVSSTLYNAALYSNMEIVKRRNHSLPSNYVPISRDAVISSGQLDLIIKNPYEYPLIIKSGASGGIITVQIYGNVESAQKVTLKSEIIEKEPRGVTYINDPTLAEGKEKIKSPGSDKIVGRLYKTVNGITTVVSTDVYPARNKVVLKGTKPVEITTPPAVATTPTDTNTTPKPNESTVTELIGR